MGTLMSDPITPTELIERLSYANYVYNRVELNMPAWIYAKYSADGPRFESWLQAELEAK